MQKITTFLMYNDKAEEAMNFYVSIFKDGKIVNSIPGPEGKVIGGTFEGPRLKGKVLPPGGDWLVTGAGNVRHLDVRALLVTDDDQRIYMTYNGIISQPQGGALEENRGGAQDRGALPRSFPSRHRRMRVACCSLGCLLTTGPPELITMILPPTTMGALTGSSPTFRA